MIALTPDGEFRNESLESEVRTALTNLMAVLESQGMTAANLAKCSLFLRDMADFAAVNAIYTEFMGEAKPARETVAVLGLPKDARFEISAVAYLPL
jgi:2-iminobutanoate/2-iminopropanoate deaminase